MQHRYTNFERRLRECVLESAGDSAAAVRSSAAAYAANPGATRVPEALHTYIDKVARFAYRVTDDDVEALKHAGYSEDAIFEVTVAAAMGAGLHRLERGLAVLKEGS